MNWAAWIFCVIFFGFNIFVICQSLYNRKLVEFFVQIGFSALYVALMHFAGWFQ